MKSLSFSKVRFQFLDQSTTCHYWTTGRLLLRLETLQINCSRSTLFAHKLISSIHSEYTASRSSNFTENIAKYFENLVFSDGKREKNR